MLFSCSYQSRALIRNTYWNNVCRAINFRRSISSTTRHSGLHLHPESISQHILPGNQVERTTRKGLKTLRYTELVYGYFWMLRDLRQSDNRPLLPTTIPTDQAKVFPHLPGLQSLSKNNNNNNMVNLPEYIWRKNRSGDAHAQCTLVALAYRDFGFQQLPSWVDPFRTAASAKKIAADRYEAITINMAQGWLNRWMLRWLIVRLNQQNTPSEHHASTFVCFGEHERFRDDLRMHNILPGYVFLLDGLGRVRFAASGEATDEGLHQMLHVAEQIVATDQPRFSGKKQQKRAKRR